MYRNEMENREMLFPAVLMESHFHISVFFLFLKKRVHNKWGPLSQWPIAIIVTLTHRNTIIPCCGLRWATITPHVWPSIWVLQASPLDCSRRHIYGDCKEESLCTTREDLVPTDHRWHLDIGRVLRPHKTTSAWRYQPTCSFPYCLQCHQREMQHDGIWLVYYIIIPKLTHARYEWAPYRN